MSQYCSEHMLGKNFHIFDQHPFLQEVMSIAGSPGCIQPLLSIYVNKAYDLLLSFALNEVLTSKAKETETRMIESTEKGIAKFQGFDRNQKFVVLDLARAGTEPSLTCFNSLNLIFDPKGIRQDHIYVNRAVDENGKVCGVNMSGSKIGGDFQDSIVIIPDPMGATGGSIVQTVKFLKDNYNCDGATFVIIHLVITPEYVLKVRAQQPNIEVFSVRYDRGLSSQEVLNLPFGKNIEQERGLNDIDYIVPGAGGMGEVLNNSFV